MTQQQRVEVALFPYYPTYYVTHSDIQFRYTRLIRVYLGDSVVYNIRGYSAFTPKQDLETPFDDQFILRIPHFHIKAREGVLLVPGKLTSNSGCHFAEFVNFSDFFKLRRPIARWRAPSGGGRDAISPALARELIGYRPAVFHAVASGVVSILWFDYGDYPDWTMIRLPGIENTKALEDLMVFEPAEGFRLPPLKRPMKVPLQNEEITIPEGVQLLKWIIESPSTMRGNRQFLIDNREVKVPQLPQGVVLITARKQGR